MQNTEIEFYTFYRFYFIFVDLNNIWEKSSLIHLNPIFLHKADSVCLINEQKLIKCV